MGVVTLGRWVQEWGHLRGGGGTLGERGEVEHSRGGSPWGSSGRYILEGGDEQRV